MSLLAPSSLLLLLAIPIVWFWPRRVRDVGLGLARSVLLAVLALALARPVWVHESAVPHHVLVHDGGRVAGEFDTVIDASDSKLCAALAAAALAIPDGAPGSVTLVSDGFATDNGSQNTVFELSQRGIPLHVRPLVPEPLGPRPVALTAEGIWRVGHTARLRVKLAGGSALLTLRGPDGVLATSESDLLEFEPAAPGFLKLQVEAGGFVRERTFAIQDPLRVWYRGSRVKGGEQALRDLVGAGFRFEQSGEQADLVVIDDLPAGSFPAAEQEELVRAVTERGTGLFVAGGKASFGPGGYHRSPIEASLPVEFEQKREKRDPSTTLVVIIDTSGSMMGSRVQLAKEVARLAIRRLLPHDKVGIVEFYGAKRWAAPIQPASNAIEIQRALNRMTAGGGTIIMPAIEESYYALQNVRTRYKHVLVLTDGGVEAGAFEPLLRKMARKGMNVSTVLIGGGAHSDFLVSLARWGKGRFYSVPDRFNLPEVILKLPSTTRLPAYRSGSHDVKVRGGPGWLGTLDEVPAVSGYVQLRVRRRAETLLETTAAGHPLLASWRYGLGRVTAMATEPTGPGTASWEKWEGYGPMLARIMARTARGGSEPYRYRLSRRGAFLHLEAKRIRPAPPPSARSEATPIALRRRAPDLFTATLPWPPEREARIVAGTTRLVSDAFGDIAPEEMVDVPLDLPAIATATGGKLLGPNDTPVAGGAIAPFALTRLRPGLLLGALLLFLTELVYRRWPR
ncbi:MAG: vWA domain-containing protein [Planctomycetota bacterium]